MTWEGATITPTEGRPTRAVYIRNRTCRPKVDLVEKGGMSTERRPTESILFPSRTSGTEHPLLPSREVGNPRVRELHHFSHRPLRMIQAAQQFPNLSKPRHPRTIRTGRIPHLPRPNYSFARWKELRTPSPLSNLLLQGFVLFWTIARYSPPSFARFVILTVFLANDRQQTNDRIVGILGRSTRQIALRTCF